MAARLFLSTSQALAAETLVEAPKELHYPPIHIQVTESKLGPEMSKDKEELVKNSQILEDILHGSGAVYDDPELEKAIQGLVPVDQMGDEARGFYFRVYILKDPNLNAVTTPSGSIYVNSGLLAVLDNFDQLRAVMAHESHHAIGQDMVYEYKNSKDKIGFFKVFNILAAPAVAYAIGESDNSTGKVIANSYTGASVLMSISFQLSLYGYSRGRENDADVYAMEMLEKNHKDVYEVKRLFQKFDDEKQKYSKEIFQTHLFLDHETARQRMDRVEKFAKEHGHPQDSGAPPLDMNYYELTRDVRIVNARLNLRIGRVQHALDDLNRLETVFPKDARVKNGLGEAYAKLAEDRKPLQSELSGKEWKKIKHEKEEDQRVRWAAEAMTYFQNAAALDPSYPDPYRGEALLKETLKENQKAVELFQKYLELAPQAKDHRYVRAKLERLKGLIKKERDKQAEKKGDK